MPLDAAMVDADLRRLHAKAREAWPGVSVDEERYVRHVAGVLPQEGELADVLGGLHADDLYLACACADGDQRALQIFDETFIARVPAFVGKIRNIPLSSDELKQEVRHRLLVADEGSPPRIALYAGRGPLVGWVRVAATRFALDLCRTRSPEGAVAAPESIPAFDDDAELTLLRRRYANDVREALAAAIGALDPHGATILRLHFLEGLKAEAIATSYGTSARTVQRWIRAAREAIIEETRKRLRERLGSATAQVDTLIRLAQSDINPSIVEFLAKTTK